MIPCMLKFETEVVIIGEEWRELKNTHLLFGRVVGLEFGDTADPQSWSNQRQIQHGLLLCLLSPAS